MKVRAGASSARIPILTRCSPGMRSHPRKLTLTADHVARVHRLVQDQGSPPGVELHTDVDYERWVEKIIETHPAVTSPTLIFAYGSLIWKPEIELVG